MFETYCQFFWAQPSYHFSAWHETGSRLWLISSTAGLCGQAFKYGCWTSLSMMWMSVYPWPQERQYRPLSPSKSCCSCDYYLPIVSFPSLRFKLLLFLFPDCFWSSLMMFSDMFKFWLYLDAENYKSYNCQCCVFDPIIRITFALITV